MDLRPGPPPDRPLPRHAQRRPRRVVARLLRALVALTGLALVGGLAGAPAASALTPAPISLSVSAGPSRGGTAVTITGQRLTTASKVWFGSTAVTSITRYSSTRIRVTTPPHAAGTVYVKVTTADGTSATSPRATFAFDDVPTVTGLTPDSSPTPGGTTAPATFTYRTVPTVSSLTVKDGPVAGGTVVTIHGTGLGRTTAVVFGRTLARNLTQVSDTAVRVTSPPHSAGPVIVKVGSAGGISAAVPAATFTYHPTPTVVEVRPGLGPVSGGTTITVVGTGFSRSSVVLVGGSPVPSTFVGPTALSVTTPAHQVGTVSIVVRTPGGTSPAAAHARFEYLPVPTLSSASGDAGPLQGGTSLVLVGTGFLHAQGVAFGPTTTSDIDVVSDTELRVVSPTRPAGTVSLRVITPGGASEQPGVDFTYQPVPSLSALSATLSSERGGIVLTITGQALERTSLVEFGDIAATNVEQVSPTQLRVTVPAHTEGAVDVRVTTPGGRSVPVAGGRFTFQNPPSVAALSPATGPLAGGTVVTLSGSSLTDVAGVWFGDLPATAVTRVDAKTLLVTVPTRSSTGTTSVRVTTRAGTTVRPAAWTYRAGAALGTGQVLVAGTALVSPDGTSVAMMRYDGNLLVARSGVVQWQSGTSGANNALTVRADGSVVVLTAAGAVAWSSGTAGFSGAGLALGNDGILVVRQGPTSVWDQRGRRYDRVLGGQALRTGESLVSNNRAWVLTMRYDGNLMLASSTGRQQWSSVTSGTGNRVVVLVDGNVVVRSSSGSVLWSTGTSGRAGSYLRLLDNGNLAVYQRTTVAWALNGGPVPDDWACYVYASRACISRFGYVGQRVWNYPTDPWGNNCTNYSAFRLSKDGVANPGNLGNANTWDDNARAKGFRVDQRPVVGTIAQWNSNHVAYVDWVSADGNTVAISESSYGGTVLGMTFLSGSGRRILTRGSSSWPSNFIHFR